MSIYRRNKVYYISYSDATGRRRREAVGSDYNLAKAALASRRGDIVKGKFDLAKNNSITLEDFSSRFIEYVKHRLKPSSLIRYEKSLKVLSPVFGKMILSKITRRHIEDFIASRRRTVKGSTCNRDLACLSKLFAVAIELGQVAKSPLDRTLKRFKEKGNTQDKFLTAQQVADLLNAAKGNRPLYLFCLLCLNCGLRHSEALSLKWRNVDFDNSVLILTNTKNGKREAVPINSRLYNALKNETPNGEYVISSPDGSRFLSLKKSFKTAARRAGLSPDVSPHWLRHSFAAALIKNNVDLETVRRLGRWSDYSMVLRYAHAEKETQKNAVESIFQ